MGYWGLAQCQNWSTLDWLQGRAQTASQFSDPEQFANALAADLNGALANLPLTPFLEKGLGIHFTAYERINDYWIPELFLGSQIGRAFHIPLYDQRVLERRERHSEHSIGHRQRRSTRALSAA